MPETEPKPKLIELVAPGGGQGWKAVLKSGKPAVVHEIQVPPAEAVAAAPRLQRLFEHRHPALSPVLAWGTDASGVWVAVEPNEGTPLNTVLSRGPLTPPAAATLGELRKEITADGVHAAAASVRLQLMLHGQTAAPESGYGGTGGVSGGVEGGTIVDVGVGVVDTGATLPGGTGGVEGGTGGTGGGSGLPVTGGRIAIVLGAGTVLLVAGRLLTLLARRRFLV